jgi:DNA-nicking Smr family endonuclease
MGAKAGGDRPKPLSGDALLWKRVQESAVPLKRRAPVATPVFPPAAPPGNARAPRAAPRPAPPSARPAAELRPGTAPGFDKSTHDKLKRGHLPIQGKLDLHGMDRARAHGALGRFLARAAEQGRRCVLVVTGKGGAKGLGDRPGERGVLQSEVPRWLNEAPLRALILAFAPAQPRHGGAGALYVYLRRRRAP